MNGLIMGNLPATCEHTEHYFLERMCFVDVREGGGVLAVSKDSHIGIGVKILTSSHDVRDGNFGAMIGKNVTIKPYAWVGSFAILYNCTIEEHCVVGVGSVVANQHLEPYTMVDGNPARVIARFYDGRWHGER